MGSFHSYNFCLCQDCRTTVETQGRSINMTLSARGREALKELGLEESVLKMAVPVHSRKIHSESGNLSTSPYSINGDCIYSLDRLNLNRLLLDQAEKHPNITLHFKHKLIGADLSKKQLSFIRPSTSEKEVTKAVQHVETDFIFGCDGAFSSIRHHMMQAGRLNFSQETIEHGYKELSMPAEDGKYAMDGNCLHVWPRGEFMLLALPNLDHTFTITLFMPFAMFESIKKEEDLIAFFTKNFPDALARVGIEKLVQDYFSNPVGKLTSVKCNPHVMADSVVLLGDAAHAVVPFYGQGMNAGFEDCLIFFELLTKTNNDLTKAAGEYSVSHWRDSHAIADLSMDNYIELRSRVSSPMFTLQKRTGSFLHRYFPQFYTPLYSMVAFSRTPYHKAVVKDQLQKKAMNIFLLALIAFFIGVILCLLCVLLF